MLQSIANRYIESKGDTFSATKIWHFLNNP